MSSGTSKKHPAHVLRFDTGRRILYHRKFFETVEPLNFTTFTTPHVGLAPYPISSSIVFWFGSRLLGRTGSQLYCVDSWSSTGMPLLEVMSRKGRMACFLLLLASDANNECQVSFFTTPLPSLRKSTCMPMRVSHLVVETSCQFTDTM